jgi:hypothetical protein
VLYGRGVLRPFDGYAAGAQRLAARLDIVPRPADWCQANRQTLTNLKRVCVACSRVQHTPGPPAGSSAAHVRELRTGSNPNSRESNPSKRVSLRQQSSYPLRPPEAVFGRVFFDKHIVIRSWSITQKLGFSLSGSRIVTGKRTVPRLLSKPRALLGSAGIASAQTQAPWNYDSSGAPKSSGTTPRSGGQFKTMSGRRARLSKMRNPYRLKTISVAEMYHRRETRVNSGSGCVVD